MDAKREQAKRTGALENLDIKEVEDIDKMFDDIDKKHAVIADKEKKEADMVAKEKKDRIKAKRKKLEDLKAKANAIIEETERQEYEKI